MKKLNMKIATGVVMILLAGMSVAMAADMTGKWILSIQAPQGIAHPEFVLIQDGDKLSGTYKGQFGESPVSGTVNGNDFEMSYEARGSKTIYKGTVDENKMSGSASFGGGMTIIAFTGEKQ